MSSNVMLSQMNTDIVPDIVQARNQ